MILARKKTRGAFISISVILVLLSLVSLIISMRGWAVVSAETNPQDDHFEGSITSPMKLQEPAGQQQTPQRNSFTVYGEGQTFGNERLFTSPNSFYTNDLAWADADGDGDLDLAAANSGVVNFLTDVRTEHPNVLYRNLGDGVFSAENLPIFSGDHTAVSLAWGDVDNDNDLDLAVVSIANAPYTIAENLLYRNDGTGHFTVELIDADASDTRDVVWGDFNGDGHLDLLTSFHGGIGNSGIYYNDGAGNLTSPPIPLATSFDHADVGDMDNDGDLDIVTVNSAKARVYRNDAGVFVNVWVSSLEPGRESVHWADLDDDGDLDIATAGEGVFSNSFTTVSLFYRNADDSFSPQYLNFPNGSYAADLDVGDVDLDGDIDIALAGVGTEYLFRNSGNGNFALETTGFQVSGVRRMALGDADGDGALDVAYAFEHTVRNYILRNDSVSLHFSAETMPMENFSNNSRDGKFGDFDGDGDLDFANNTTLYENRNGDFSNQFATTVNETEKMSIWGDADNDGDLDLLTAQSLHINNGDNTFTIQPHSAAIQATAIAFGDIDGDGDLDVAQGANGFNRIWRNDGVGGFSAELIDTTLQIATDVAFGDMDNDGDLDLAVVNETDIGISGVNQIFKNDGDGNFTEDFLIPADLYHSTGVAWADADGDGDLDIAVSNEDWFDQLLINDGAGNFTTKNITHSPFESQDIEWADMDNDGDLDIAIPTSEDNLLLLVNDGSGDFIIHELFVSVTEGANLTWIDLENDGDMDIVLDEEIWMNYRNDIQNRNAVNRPPRLAQLPLDTTALAKELSMANIITDTVIPIHFIASDAEGDKVGAAILEYSLNGGDNWQRAIAASGTVTTQLETAIQATETTATPITDNAVTQTNLNLNRADQTVRDLHVAIDFDHANSDQLQAALFAPWPSPAGTTVRLFDDLSHSSVPAGQISGSIRFQDSASLTIDEPLLHTSYPAGDGSDIIGLGQNDFTLELTTATTSISDLDLKVVIEHSDVDDLTIQLIGPAPTNTISTQFINHSVVSACGTIINPTYDDEAAGFISCPAGANNERFRPFPGRMDDFDGQNANGTWTLRITNNGVDAGTLQYWRLDIAGSPNLLDGAYQPLDALAAFDGMPADTPLTLILTDTAASGTGTVNSWQITSNGIEHQFNWDTFANGIFGRFDTLALRLRGAESSPINAAVSYPNGTGGAHNHVPLGDSSYWYRLQGTQIRVLQSATPDTTLDLGLVGYWDFEEGAGTVAADQSGGGNNGALVGSASWSSTTYSAESSSAIDINGFWGYVNLPTNYPATADDFTYSSWVYWRGGNDNQNFFNFGPWPARSFYLSPNADGTNLRFWINDGNVGTEEILNAPMLVQNQWVHVAVTLNGNEGTIWVDGAAVATGPINFDPSDIIQAGSHSWLGFPNTENNNYLNAIFDETRLYDRALNSAEISVLAGQQVASQVSAGSNALVYRLPAGQASNAQPLADDAGVPLRTDGNGYLRGRGQVALNDTLYAIVPVDENLNYTTYLASGVPTTSGIDGTPILTPGLQTLVADQSTPLILFDLDISLEWDARNDLGFLADLDRALDNASAVLFDASNGQIALGNTTVYHAKENWTAADIVIFASRGIRPVANIGGLVDTGVNDISLTGVITNAFLPGQVRMGTNWDPFGSNAADLGLDWQRALAHELSHYLLYLPDNYIGIVNDSLAYIDCYGSFMTNTYDDDYSEFLREDEWITDPDCLTTVAELETGRNDWETITNFYPELADTTASTQLNAGPSFLPVDFNSIQEVEPAESATILPIRTYDLRGAEGNNDLLAIPRAEGYLLKSNGTPADLTDDTLIQLGAAGGGGDRMVVRGADEGDRVCVVDAESTRLGCTAVTATSVSILLEVLPDWQPEIAVTPVTSVTLEITVTLPAPVAGLELQVIPAYGSEQAPDIITGVHTVMAGGGMQFTSLVTLDYTVLEGSVRVWVPGSSPALEAVSQYYLNAEFWGGNMRAWGGNMRAWGGNMRAWGGNMRAWGAPTTSGDGQVSVFNADNPFDVNGISSLQALPRLPELPIWLTSVGNGYRVVEEATYNIADQNRVISFNYLQSQVPAGYEFSLNIYYSADFGETWQRLDTIVDQDQNLATARLADPANGIYSLLSTVDVPTFAPGWNNFGYPIPETRMITDALASIDGFYTEIYQFDAANGGRWALHDVAVKTEHPEFESIVNDLTELEFAKAYWINVTDTITLYLGVPTTNNRSVVAAGSFQLPPTTFYGWVLPTPSFTPAAGSTVEARINGVSCGQATVFNWQGQLAYKLQVEAENLLGTPNNCGQTGATVAFYVDGVHQTNVDHNWNNTQAWFHPLTDNAVVTAIQLSSFETGLSTRVGVLISVVFFLLMVQIGVVWFREQKG